MRHDPSPWTQKCVHATSALVKSASGHICVPINCAKPIVLQVDEDGRRHFPGHAKASKQVWLAVGGNPMAARLMGMDMDAHLLKADGIAEFAARPEAATLLLTALAEVHSNAAMFGGIESDGFKIKAKHLEKRGRQVIAAMDWGITRAAA